MSMALIESQSRLTPTATSSVVVPAAASHAELMSRAFLDFFHPDDVEDAIDGLSALPSGEDVTKQTALAREQAALRRVATLAARESSSDEVFAAVVEEVGRIVGVESTAMLRYEDDETATPVASWGAHHVPAGARFTLEESLCSRLFATARPARVDHYADEATMLAAVGVPIIVDGGLWGAMIAYAAEPLPEDTASRMARFTELVTTAIANIDARSALTASRARIVAAADEERRRIARDLHDGAQQRLVHTIITLKLAQRALESDASDASSLVGEALEHAQRATHELRELAHGILPAALTAGGLRAAVEALTSRMLVPIQVEICADRLPATIEATAYFVVAEALTNVAKHACATSAAVAVRVVDSALQVEVSDDGVGGVRPEGSGLQGLRDRLAALDGRLQVASPADGGSVVAAVIPVATSS
jgi:signal transduction histidine kinase